MELKHLKVSTDADGVVQVELDRAPVNAVNTDMYIEIAWAFRNIETLAPGGRAVVLTAAGRHFCAGNDLEEFATMSPENGDERMWRVREAFFAISRCAIPVIGAVHGSALGTGLAIAGSCDFVVAEPDARFGLPEMTVGVMGGARHLARMAPEPLVRRMFFTSEVLNATDFADAGGCIVVCAAGQVREHARQLALRVAGFSPTAVRRAKVILDRIEWMTLEEGYAFEQAGTVRMSGHPDSKEALAAFREKRPPSYAASAD